MTRFEITRADPRNMTDAEYAAVHELDTLLDAERLPGDPPVPYAEMVQGMRNIPAFVDVTAWGVRDSNSGRLVGTGDIGVTRLEQNRHLAEFNINVHPDYRRQGIARRLLPLIVERARTEQRTLLQGNSNSNVPAGEAFLRRIGATLGLSMHTNQLMLTDLNRALLAEWLELGRQLTAEFELAFWDGDYPEADLPSLADLHNVMNDQPREDLHVEDWHITPQMLRDFERSWTAHGGSHWTLAARHHESGELAGFTDVIWYPSHPELLNQGNTGVWPRYRNRGIGRWLKAAMLDKVMRERPSITKVRTSNAFSNAPMLKLNHALGFKLHHASLAWQVPVERVEAYLAMAAGR
ncbi:MAG: GNAT family N-acetyltransferase [Chloroflexi bacterium]|nr:GNAT family N-acetyltransferase [Chloroflexota bacterium]